MATELWYPIPQYVLNLPATGHRFTLRELCEKNGIACRYHGTGADREIWITRSKEPFIKSLPHQGAVHIGTRYPIDSKQSLRYALAAMAYALFDVAARESVRMHKGFNQIKRVGRPYKGPAKSNAQRQREYRLRKRLQGH